MHVWQLQEAKAKFSRLIKDSANEPQIISRHGINESIVLSMVRYKKLIGQKRDVGIFFRKSPLAGLDLDIKRDKSRDREVNL